MTDKEDFDTALKNVKYAFKTAMKYVNKESTGPDLYMGLHAIHNRSVFELEEFRPKAD